MQSIFSSVMPKGSLENCTRTVRNVTCAVAAEPRNIRSRRVLHLEWNPTLPHAIGESPASHRRVHFGSYRILNLVRAALSFLLYYITPCTSPCALDFLHSLPTRSHVAVILRDHCSPLFDGRQGRSPRVPRQIRCGCSHLHARIVSDSIA